MRIRVNLFTLVRQLEVQEQRRYTVTDLAQALGVTRNTVNELLESRSKAIYFDTLVALVRFFRERGLNVNIEDMLVLEEEVENTHQN